MEQFIEGTVAAFVARFWVVGVTAFLMRAKAEKIYDTVVDPREAKFKICVDSLRYFLGATLALGTMGKPFFLTTYKSTAHLVFSNTRRYSSRRK